MTDQQRIMKECWSCQSKRDIPGNSHIRCATPDADMTGNEHGIRSGWFMYPLIFDPVWKTKLCSNYVPKNSDAVSDAVSGVISESKAQ